MGSWEDLPDLPEKAQPKKAAAWEDLPDRPEGVDEPVLPSEKGGAELRTPDTGAFGEATPAVMGVGKGASLGFVDELAGAAPTLAKASLGGAGYLAGSALLKHFAPQKPLEDLEAADVRPEAPEPTYREGRDTYRRQEKAAQEQGPKQFLAGDVGGSMLLPIPGGAGAKGLKKIAYAAATGGLLGGTGAAGGSEADLTKGEVGPWLKDIGEGMGSGAVVAGGLTAGGVGARKFLGTAEERALKASGAIQKDLQKVSPEDQRRIGRTLLDADVIPAFGSKASILERAKSATAPASQEIGDILTKADATAERSPSAAVTAKLRELAGKQSQLAAGGGLERALENRAQNVAERAPEMMTATEVANQKRAFDRLVNWNPSKGPVEPIANQANKAAANAFRGAEEAIVEKALGPEELQSFKAAKGRFGDLQMPMKWAQGGVDREAGNNFFGPTASGMGTAVFAGGGESLSSLTAGGAVAIAAKLAKQRGDAAAAVFLNSIDQGKLLPLVQALSAANIRAAPVAGSKLKAYFSGEGSE